ncbi:hypothetical protein FQA39_LY07070 [Lamprigera yunnana]|nr:hypothetical protein FQA39_LY07070 [Lamprigera yunnana]
MQAASFVKNSYFKKRLTLAISYSVTGTGLLPLIMPQITNFLLISYGTRGTILILAAISFHSIIGSLLLRPIRLKPSDSNKIKEISAIRIQQLNETESLLKKDNISFSSNLYKLLDLDMFRDRAFVILIIVMSVSYVSELNFNLINPFVLSELCKLQAKDVALAMSIQAVGDVCGRLFIPSISFKFKWPSKVMFLLTLIGSCVGRTVFVYFSNVKNIILAISILVGLSKGGRAVYQSLVLPEHVSIEKLPLANGFVMITNGILSLAIGPFIGFIHDISGSYTYVLQSATLLSTMCAVILTADILITILNKKRNKDIQINGPLI